MDTKIQRHLSYEVASTNTIKLPCALEPASVQGNLTMHIDVV
jgi:hypothetical protein